MSNTALSRPVIKDKLNAILVYSSKKTGLIPTISTLDSISSQVLELKNSAGNGYTTIEIENPTTTKEIEISPSDCLGYSPQSGFDTVIYYTYVENTKDYVPVGYTILGNTYGYYEIDNQVSIYQTKIILDIGDIFDRLSPDIPTPNTNEIPLNTSLEFSDVLRKYLKPFKKKQNLPLEKYSIEPEFPFNSNLFKKIEVDLLNIKSVIGPKFFCGWDGIPRGVYKLISKSGKETIIQFPESYGAWSNDFPDLKENTAFIVARVAASLSASDILSSDREAPIFDVWSSAFISEKSIFNQVNEIYHRIPVTRDLILPLTNFFRKDGTIRILAEIGEWFLFHLPQYSMIIAVNHRTAVAIPDKYLLQIFPINDRAILVREEEGLYLFNKPGIYCTQITKNLISITYPYSKVLSKFNEGGDIVDEDNLSSGPLGRYRHNKLPPEKSKIIGAVKGLIFYEHEADNKYTIDYI